MRNIKATNQLEPTIFVIFGGAGDLTWRKLAPALFDLWQDRSLSVQFAFLGYPAKYPGSRMQLRPVELRFNYRESFTVSSPEVYETMLWDVTKNDTTFVSTDVSR
jgi:glucose-6-phosphate 1-dehydrogenase